MLLVNLLRNFEEVKRIKHNNPHIPNALNISLPDLLNSSLTDLSCTSPLLPHSHTPHCHPAFFTISPRRQPLPYGSPEIPHCTFPSSIHPGLPASPISKPSIPASDCDVQDQIK